MHITQIHRGMSNIHNPLKINVLMLNYINNGDYINK